MHRCDLGNATTGLGVVEVASGRTSADDTIAARLAEHVDLLLGGKVQVALHELSWDRLAVWINFTTIGNPQKLPTSEQPGRPESKLDG